MLKINWITVVKLDSHSPQVEDNYILTKLSLNVPTKRPPLSHQTTICLMVVGGVQKDLFGQLSASSNKHSPNVTGVRVVKKKIL